MEDKNRPLVAMDTENDPDGNLGRWSIAYRNNEGKLCVWSNHGVGWDNELEKIYRRCSVAFHNYKWDARVLDRNIMPVPTDIHDSMVLGYCMDLGRQDVRDSTKGRSGGQMVGGLGLKYLARRHLGMDMKTWKEVFDKPEDVPLYNAEDSIATLLLAEKWLPQVGDFYWKIDRPLLHVLMAIEDRGIRVDPEVLLNMDKELTESIEKFDELPKYLAFHTHDLRSYVYGTLGIEPIRFTKGGAPSTDADMLETIDDPLIKEILEYKSLYKEKGTYVDNYVNACDEAGRIHPELKQTSTATARLSCAKPNLQNVFKVGERVKLRALFAAPPGKKIVRMDYHLVEFGMLAVLAQDEKMIKAFLTGDVHQETADGLGIDRDTGKHINFLMQNGGTAWGMSQTYGIPIGQAQIYYNKYYERFPAIGRFQQETVERAKETGKVYSWTGRTHQIDALLAEDYKTKKDGEKEAKTYPMQNGAAEVVKLAMIDLHYKHHAPQLLQIHDEILFEVDEKDAEEYAHWLKAYVPTITEVNGVQFPVTVGFGNNWYEAMQHEI